VQVEHYSPEALRRLVVSEYELLFVGDPEVIVKQLSGYLDEHLHQRLTGSQIRSLTVPGVRPRLLAGDLVHTCGRTRRATAPHRVRAVAHGPWSESTVAPGTGRQQSG
jgi:hypothetical protein